ncbi:MAG: hypothetical protein MUC96_24305 [Myxococcaceae bacterium]|nr:hypothetical protein [Myxococcaceae bacterium]
MTLLFCVRNRQSPGLSDAREGRIARYAEGSQDTCSDHRCAANAHAAMNGDRQAGLNVSGQLHEERRGFGLAADVPEFCDLLDQLVRDRQRCRT